jgi:ankyrin repeat protein
MVVSTKKPTERVEEAVRLLLRYGASVDPREKENATQLHIASESSDTCRMKAILECGGDLQGADD